MVSSGLISPPNLCAPNRLRTAAHAPLRFSPDAPPRLAALARQGELRDLWSPSLVLGEVSERTYLPPLVQELDPWNTPIASLTG